MDFFNTVAPPPIVLWISLVLLLMRIGVIINNLFKEKKNTENSINDTFWYREVIIPYCLEPLKDFIISQSDTFSLLSSESEIDEYEKYLHAFKKEQGVVINKMTVTRAVNQDIYPFVQAQLEVLEDEIAQYCGKKAINYINEKDLGKADVETKFHQTLCNIIKEFRVKHHSLFK